MTTASNEMSIPEDPQNPAVTSDTPADVDNDHEWEVRLHTYETG